jgi:hypothetical protein
MYFEPHLLQKFANGRAGVSGVVRCLGGVVMLGVFVPCFASEIVLRTFLR